MGQKIFYIWFTLLQIKFTANEGVNQKWFSADLPDTRIVTIPHTWNVEQGSEMYYGWAWYQKKFNVPSSWKNKNTILQFGAINHTSVVYINGKKAGENIGVLIKAPAGSFKGKDWQNPVK